MTFTSLVEQYLAQRRCALWPGQAWDVSDPKERRKAAKWLATVIREVEEMWEGPPNCATCGLPETQLATGGYGCFRHLDEDDA